MIQSENTGDDGTELETIEDVESGKVDAGTAWDIVNDSIEETLFKIYVGNLDNMTTCPYVCVYRLEDGRILLEDDNPNLRYLEIFDEVDSLAIQECVDNYLYSDHSDVKVECDEIELDIETDI